jgi:hypothetical protein
MITPLVGDDDVTPTTTRDRGRLGLLAEHDFRQLFVADSGSRLGTQIGVLALPLDAHAADRRTDRRGVRSGQG